jgi:two-component system chemotaxis sensor kinase CheA
LNQDAIVKKALEKGIVSPEQRLTEHEIFQLIFAPGFSTAAVVTDISGRGVGMDVVKRNIEEMRGRILIKSIPGQGSTFTVELPLTLAILDGIEAVVGGERLIIPALNVIEFIKPTSDMLTETLDRGETLRFRGDFLPIFRIGTLFGIESQRTQLDECILMVVDGNGERVALVVDDVVGKLPAVIKSLGSVFRHVQGVAGCAVMPDGGVALIVDVSTFVQAARLERKGFGYSAREEIHIH